MATGIADKMLAQLSQLVAEQMGLSFPRERWGDLERGINSAAREKGFNNPESYLEQLLSAPLTKSQIEILASHLTIGETYFFREKRSFEVLQEHLLPRLINARREKEKNLRIWSAGCATGEEPYSIAISLSKLIPDLSDWNITILATDLNPRFLQRAARAVYKEWSFRNAPSWLKEKYFKPNADGGYELDHSIKKMVTFTYLNLAEDIYPSLLNHTNAMDIIFCRNVLMYFTSEKAGAVVRNLRHCLIEEGWLIVSPTETSPHLFSRFVTCNFPGVVFYRKDGRHSSQAEDTPRRVESILENEVFQFPARFDAHALPGATGADAAEKAPVEIPPATVAESVNTERPPDSFAEALALYEQGQYGKIMEILFPRIASGQADTQTLSLIARACANQGQLDEARSWCEKAIGSDLLNPGLHYLRATILQELGEMDQAEVSLKQALYIDQDFVLAHFALGLLAFRREKLKTAKKHFENALILLKRCPEEKILPESEGITAGRLAEIIQSNVLMEKSA